MLILLLHGGHGNCGVRVGHIRFSPQLCNSSCLGVEFDALLAVAGMRKGQNEKKHICNICDAYKCSDPKKLPRVPVNENIGRGTGIGTLTPTCPTSISFTNFLAVAPFVVKIAVPFP